MYTVSNCFKILTRTVFSSIRNESQLTSFKNKTEWDIVIAGGGIIGMAMACALAKNTVLNGQKILLLEGSGKKRYETVPKSSDSYSNRVVSINPGSKQFIESVGAWKYISDCRYKQVKKLYVWDACSDARITFEEDNIDNEISYIVENDLIIYALHQALCDEIPIRWDCKVHQVTLPKRNGDKVVVEVENGETIMCKLLLGAEGWNSHARRAIDGESLAWNYNQMGIVATLIFSEATRNDVAWQRFLPKGPIALLPLSDTMSSLVWTTSLTDAKELLKLSDESFVDAVNDALWKIYDKNAFVSSAMDCVTNVLKKLPVTFTSVKEMPPSIEKIVSNSRAAFPLGFGHSSNYVAKGCAVIGDAAHRVHPLAGLGVNLGFGDVRELTKILSKAVLTGETIGSLLSLKDYEKNRLLYNIPTMVTIDGIHHLNKSQLPPVVLLRSLALQITDALPPLKIKGKTLSKTDWAQYPNVNRGVWFLSIAMRVHLFLKRQVQKE